MSIKITKLESGLTVATDPMPHLETAAVGVWASVGARFETEENLGISHFLEHMAFKGTERRTSRQIVEGIESVGGYLNAYTSREQTAYYARVLKDDVPLAIDTLSDILTHSTFEPEETERERSVILQEIGQCADNPEDLIFDHLQETAYPNQPIGRPILGTIESVGAMKRDQLFAHMAEHYDASSLFLVASGAVNHEAIVDAAQSGFSDLPTTKNNVSPIPAQYEGGSQYHERSFEQAHVTLGFPGVSVLHDDLFVAQVFSEIFGGSMSSRLFQEVREKRGLCYSIYSFNAAYADDGLFGIYAGTSESSLNELIRVTIGEIEKLTTDVRDDEIARAVAQAKAGILMGLESPHARCEWIAKHLPRYGRVLTPDELVTQIESVDAGRIKRFAERIMETKKPTIAALGAISDLESYDHFAAQFAS